MAAHMKDNIKEMFPQAEDSLNGQMELNISVSGEEDSKMAREYSSGTENRCEDYGKAGTGFAGSDKLLYLWLAAHIFKNYQSFLQLV